MKTKLSGVAFVVAAALLSSVTAAHGHVVLPTNPVALKRVAQELNVQLAAVLARAVGQPHHVGIDANLDLLIGAAHAGGSLAPYIDQVVADAKERLHAAVAALLPVGGNFLAAVPAAGNVDVSTTGVGFNIPKPGDDQRDTFIAGLDATLDGFKTMDNLAVLDAEVAVPGGKDVVEIAKVANAVHHAVAKKVFEYVHGLAAADAGFTVALVHGVQTRDGLAMDLAKVAQGPQIKPQTLDQAPEPIYDAALKSVGQADCDLLIDASIVEAKKRIVAILDAVSGSDADVAVFLENGVADAMVNPAVAIRTAANEELDTFTGGGGGAANFPVRITTGRSKFEFRDALFAVLDQHKTMADLTTIDGAVAVPVCKKVSELTYVINGVHASLGTKIHDFVDGMLGGDTQLVMMPGHLRNKIALRDALRNAAEAGF
jgi:hypothetical protein